MWIRILSSCIADPWSRDKSLCQLQSYWDMVMLEVQGACHFLEAVFLSILIVMQFFWYSIGNLKFAGSRPIAVLCSIWYSCLHAHLLICASVQFLSACALTQQIRRGYVCYIANFVCVQQNGQHYQKWTFFLCNSQICFCDNHVKNKMTGTAIMKKGIVW